LAIGAYSPRRHGKDEAAIPGDPLLPDRLPGRARRTGAVDETEGAGMTRYGPESRRRRPAMNSRPVSPQIRLSALRRGGRDLCAARV
jgi:hypothetical protein